MKTDDAEIKLIMLPQRAHGAESWAKNRLANGPPRVQSNGCGTDRSVWTVLHWKAYREESCF